MDIATLEPTSRLPDRGAGSRKADARDGSFFDVLKGHHEAAEAKRDEPPSSRPARDDAAASRPAPRDAATEQAGNEPAEQAGSAATEATEAAADPASAASEDAPATPDTGAPVQAEAPDAAVVDPLLPKAVDGPTLPVPAPGTIDPAGGQPAPQTAGAPAAPAAVVPVDGQTATPAMPMPTAGVQPPSDDAAMPAAPAPHPSRGGAPDATVDADGAAGPQAPIVATGQAGGGQGASAGGQGQQQSMSQPQVGALPAASAAGLDALPDADRSFANLVAAKAGDVLPGAAAVQHVETPPSLLSTTALVTANRAGATSLPAVEQVAFRLQKAVAEGGDRISMTLKPASLGRVDVQLDVGPDGRVQAVVSVDRPETLTLLQRDARGLEQALQNAGLQADSDSLTFTLRQQAQDRNGGNGRGSDGPATDRAGGGPDDAPAPVPPSRRVALGGIDLRV